LTVNQELLKKSLPLMMILSLFTFLGLYLGIGLQLLGIALLMSFVAFCIYTVRSPGDSDVEQSLPLVPAAPLTRTLLLLLLGISFLVGGTGFFIQGAVWIAKLAGISESVIGLSIVAIGTSLPEVFTSVLAAIKKERSLVLGNIIGSNIFNLSAALGGTLVLSGPFGFGAFQIDLVVMLLSALICGPFFYSGRRVSRAEGAVLLSFYVAYFIWLLNKT
jgi:cation:H+ antiporter